MYLQWVSITECKKKKKRSVRNVVSAKLYEDIMKALRHILSLFLASAWDAAWSDSSGRTKISSSVGRRKSRQGGCVNNDTRIRSGHAKILRGDEEWPRQCAQHCLLGLCTSLLGRRNEEELFFSLLYLILKVDILIMGPKKKKKKERDRFETAPC